MIYLLDTNAVVALLARKPSPVRERFSRAVANGDVLIVPTVVLFELQYGIAKSRRQRDNIKGLRVFLRGSLSLAPFEADDAMRAGDVRATLEGQGKPIGAYDLLIAAQALRMDATLVTANVSEFSRVAGLRLQNWSMPDPGAHSTPPTR